MLGGDIPVSSGKIMLVQFKSGYGCLCQVGQVNSGYIRLG
jgi:hypothetical protein